MALNRANNFSFLFFFTRRKHFPLPDGRNFAGLGKREKFITARGNIVSNYRWKEGRGEDRA